MATSELPYRNDEDWDQLIDEVNEVLENPVGAGCEPISPIEHVPPKYRWGKQDLREMHEKIEQTCPDISFEAIPEGYVRWSQDFIDEIREKLGEAWCDCEDDAAACPNCGEEETIDWYSDPFIPKWCPSSADCTLKPENIADDILAKSIATYNALFEWIDLAADVCFLTDTISIKENQIELLETRISSKQALAAVLCDDGPSEACSAVEAEIEALEEEKALRETERDEAITEKETKEGERDAKGSETESLNTELWTLLESMEFPNLVPGAPNLASLARAAAGSHPWAVTADCQPAGVNNCIPRYTFYSTNTLGEYRVRFSGIYTPISGTSIHPPEVFAHFQYLGTTGGGCKGPDPSCTELGEIGLPRDMRIIYQPPLCPESGPSTTGGDEPDVPTSGD